MRDEAIPPREQSATIAFILSGTANLGVSLPIGLNRVFLRALVAFPLLLAVLPAEVLLDPRQVP